ncbi:cytochrome c biogenesis protein ResB [Massilia sp. TS11]|uniref:cytochrome c biogenesis protein ResB n=1 Tax=Massilia sp. TS11 TaxID=2908003 RepID=UPI001EDB1118|nr:cytochrome c biogenesis protein ResB [Massilia sp. TS11]MCG2584900.1 cytochrome c biogenesis protein ResB [Massilia sp. TS11]
METSGITLNTRRRALADTVELLSSMRFAITLLVMIAIASIIGTVMKQGEPMGNYVNQFGPFWFELFNKLSLYTVYSAWWFLLIMAFLVVSTSLCIVRNTPKMLKDMRSWRENLRENALRNFHHKVEWTSAAGRQELAVQSARRLEQGGYQVKLVEKDAATLVTAKRGAGNKFGYIFAHTAIVVICVGGMLDSDLPIRFQQWFFGKTPFMGDGLISAIPQQHRLSVSNPTFRGNTQIAEGQASDVAILQQADGVLIQELPIAIQLKKFVVDFYSTGMPKLFASEVIVKDKETGRTFPATIKVNEPLIYKGLAVYQSSFEDGGTRLKLTGYPMQGPLGATLPIQGEVHNSSLLKRGAEDYTIEFSGFRAINVESMGNNDARSVAKGESLSEQLNKQLGSAAKNAADKDLKNVGPSVQYKLRDKTGQAREYNNYMLPLTLDGYPVFLAGMRTSPADSFSYLRIPADDKNSVDEWMALRVALADPALREQAAARYASGAMANAKDKPALVDKLTQSSLKALNVFAAGGYVGVSRFLEQLPKEEQEKAAGVFMKLLNGSMWELWQVARQRAGLAAAPQDEKHGRFLQLATNALSDNFFYGAPVYLSLDSFEEVKASVLQITRSPGKKVVYLGCLLLTLGVFAMFYIRERRIWVWIKDGEAGAQALMAMSTQRKTLDFENEFKDWAAKLPQKA